MAGHSVPAVFRPTRWHSTADVTGSKRPQAGSSASLEGTWPPCCYARGPPLLSGGSASLFTSGYSATIERLYPCFDQAVPGEEPSDCSCASFSHRTAATIAVSNSAGSPVVVVAPVLPFPCYSSGVAPNTSPEDTPGDDQKCKPASLTLPVLPFVVGLENGQVWLYGWQSQPVRASAEEETLAKLEDPKCVAQHLVCRQMARPLSVCFSWKSPRPLIPSTEGGSASEDTERARSYFEVYVLYSNGVVVVWRQGRRDRIELPKVEGAVHMSVQEDGGFIAVSANTRKLTVFKRVDDGDTQKEDGSLSFQRCFEQEVFRKQLNSAVSKGYQLQTAWHPGNTSCLYIPGATNVRVLDMRTMKLESLAFASAGFDPLVVFDKIVLVSLQATRHDSISSPRSFRGVDGTDSSSCRNTSNKRTPSSVTVLLGSFRSTVRAWDLETHQLLFSIDTSYSGSPSRTGNEENLLHLAAWPAGPYSVRSKESEGSVKAEADVSPCVESLSSTQPFSPVLDVCLVRRDGAMSLMGLRPRQLLQRLSVQEECEELVEDAKEKRHGRDELPDATRKKNKDESEVDNQVTMKTDRESAVEESSDKEGKSMEPTHKQSKDVFPHSAGEDEAVEVDSFRDGRGISPSFEGGDHGKGVSKLCDSEERKAGGCLPDKTSSAVRSTSSPLRGKSEERTSVAVSSSSREFPETHTPERRGKAEKESKVIGGAEKEMAEPSSVPSQKEDRDSKKGKKKRDEKKRSRGVSTPLRRFVEMQAEEASEEDNEEGGNLFDDATIVGGVEEGTDDRRRRGRRGREKEDRQRRKKRRRKGE
ncbi:hypothetical protein CSUI_002529 [Cystoisospora suis]|uniref:Uncharacterized protein n=1 Tax=Cystoisospora suis TaxID=483139 RepID=A0A2C6KHV3_9APIC|nr:hypothetical protein CSUI_002529 [Cystoisospora suis]